MPIVEEQLLSPTELQRERLRKEQDLGHQEEIEDRPNATKLREAAARGLHIPASEETNRSALRIDIAFLRQNWPGKHICCRTAEWLQLEEATDLKEQLVQ